MRDKVTLKPGILSWAIEESQVDLSALLERYPKLGLWLSNEDTPSFSQLKQLSTYLKIPFGYMFLSSPPQEPKLVREFRTIGNARFSRISKDLKDTLTNMQAISTWMHEYRHFDLGTERLSFVGYYRNEERVRGLTAAFLDILGLKDGFSTAYRSPELLLRALKAHMENVGVLVFSNSMVGLNSHRLLNPEEFRAFCLIDEFAPIIFINGKDSKYGKVFSIVHEFLHVLRGETGATFDGRDETLCNIATINLLVPADLLSRKITRLIKDVAAVTAIAKHFNVSALALAYVLHKQNLISQKLVDEVMETTRLNIDAKNGSMAQSGPDFHIVFDANNSIFFRKALANQLTSGNASYAEAARLMGVSSPDTVSEILARAMK